MTVAAKAGARSSARSAYRRSWLRSDNMDDSLWDLRQVRTVQGWSYANAAHLGRSLDGGTVVQLGGSTTGVIIRSEARPAGSSVSHAVSSELSESPSGVILSQEATSCREYPNGSF